MRGANIFAATLLAAIQCPGPETESLASWAKELRFFILSSELWSAPAALFIVRRCSFRLTRGMLAKHRKLIPTGSERLIWGHWGRLNHAGRGNRPGPHRHGYLLGELHAVVPAASLQSGRPALVRAHGGLREIWQPSMRHIAYEGRCFVLSACQFLTKADWPKICARLAARSLEEVSLFPRREKSSAGPAEGEHC